MPKRLSERESIVLRAILDADPHGATGLDLVSAVRKALGSISPADVTKAGVHRTAASLCRKNLAWRNGTPKQQSYRITQWGREAIAGHGHTGRWVVIP